MFKLAFQRVSIWIALAIFMLAAASACEWDYDTLQMERQRFPGTLELVTGKFLRHSKEFYQWRIEDRKGRIAKDPTNLALYDDLAVAYDKTDQQSLAIETILKKEELSPGLYETYANLGTFHIHAGNLEEGVKHLKRAIEINPEAHFGREIYQQLLVEYVISKQVDGAATLPLVGKEFSSFQSGFADFVFKARQTPDNPEAKAEEAKAALKGVLGMLRFGNFQHPILLEAAGDLLRADWNKDGKRPHALI
jgi:tetratricopeptide (TPR) repeat protein